MKKLNRSRRHLRSPGRRHVIPIHWTRTGFDLPLRFGDGHVQIPIHWAETGFALPLLVRGSRVRGTGLIQMPVIRTFGVVSRDEQPPSGDDCQGMT